MQTLHPVSLRSMCVNKGNSKQAEFLTTKVLLTHLHGTPSNLSGQTPDKVRQMHSLIWGNRARPSGPRLT